MDQYQNHESNTPKVELKSTTSQADERPENVSIAAHGDAQQLSSLENLEEDLEEKPGTKQVFDSKALLFCRKNGHNHSALLDFGVLRCPACLEELTVKKRMVKTDEALDDGKKSVAYEVEYGDAGGHWIGQEAWPGPFDLQAARKGIVVQDQQVVLRFVNILRTNHQSDDRRHPAINKTLMDQGILTDPSVSVSMHSTKIVVYSQRFLKVLRKFVTYYPDINLEAQSVSISEPYCVIAHHLRELHEFQEAQGRQNDAMIPASNFRNSGDEIDENDEETHRHVNTVLKFIKSSKWEESIKKEEVRYSKNPPTCTYQMLWLLYKPGDTVYAESDGKPAAGVIQSVSVDSGVLSTQPDKLKPYKLTIWWLDFDGRHVRRFSRIITIAPFDGEKEISTLSAVPCSIFDKIDSGQRRRVLENEGERWYQLLNPKQVRYAGETMGAPRRRADGRAVIDCDAYWKENPPTKDANLGVPMEMLSREQRQKVIEDMEKEPRLVEDMAEVSTRCLCDSCLGLRQHPPSKFLWTEYDLIDPSKVESLDFPNGPRDPKHRYLLCSRRLMGFVLKSRTWEILDVACCHDIKVNTKAVDRLVMPQENKDLIKALVHRYAANPHNSTRPPPPWGSDFVEDKGHGRIFLLHGSPGVGKTYTAECIAEYTGRPLLSLTCGDLGNDETQVEQALSKWFDLAERWGAVMLLDEADVYTEKRMTADLKRNSMVSVFLRCMEYYKGILFLTTNRVGTFDDAFVSRIHVIIHYARLTLEYRNAIWGQFFDKLEDERDDIEIRRNCKRYVTEDPEMAAIPWNGREIRNAFQTAVALAYYEFSQKENKQPNEVAVLTSKHFEKVRKLTLQFKEYLKDVNDGLDENQRAVYAKSRAREGQEYGDMP
ncbi:P-loop containing nucleoside triphosphate hydrolase protein [Hypoxylon sp. NC1633]|nr:P-loop containing nucleoside triphosphate hydrolase protein [Hypoxylon sp. NC1633]